MAEWEKIIPKVNESAEFLEIASYLGDPLELFREASHNAYDWGATEFNHLFSNIRYIVCWELSSKVKDGSVLKTSVEDETSYLDSDNAAIKIKVICLKDYITQKWGISLLDQ